MLTDEIRLRTLLLPLLQLYRPSVQRPRRYDNTSCAAIGILCSRSTQITLDPITSIVATQTIYADTLTASLLVVECICADSSLQATAEPVTVIVETTTFTAATETVR